MFQMEEAFHQAKALSIINQYNFASEKTNITKPAHLNLPAFSAVTFEMLDMPIDGMSK